MAQQHQVERIVEERQRLVRAGGEIASVLLTGHAQPGPVAQQGQHGRLVIHGSAHQQRVRAAAALQPRCQGDGFLGQQTAQRGTAVDVLITLRHGGPTGRIDADSVAAGRRQRVLVDTDNRAAPASLNCSIDG